MKLTLSRLALCCSLLGVCLPSPAQGRQPLPSGRYHLRANDEIKVSYHLTPELDATVSVQPDGFVVLPGIGDIKLGGLDLEEATQAITGKAEERLNHPEVTVTLTQFDKPHFFVGGRVGKPGQYTLNGPLSALQAIQIAEGFQDSADEMQVLLIRPVGDGIGETHVLDLKRSRKHAKTAEFFVQDGDTLIVNRNKMDTVTKFVRLLNPGVYVPIT